MFSFSYTGAGWLGPLTAILSAIAGIVAGGVVRGNSLVAILLGAAAGFLLAGGVVSAIGRELNLDREASAAAGTRVYHDRHTVDGLGLQHFWVWSLLFAGACLVIVSLGVFGVRGVLTGVGAVIVLVLVVRWVRRRRNRPADPAARTASRPQLARELGWELASVTAGDVDHWSRRPHEQGHKALPEAVTGELDGVRFTVFDTRPPIRRQHPGARTVFRAVCVAELPVDYPEVHVREVWADEDGSVLLGAFVTPPLSEFRGEGELDAVLASPHAEHLVAHAAPGADWVVTPEVLRVTAEHGLSGWRLDGDRLALPIEGERSPRNAEVVAALRGLVELVRVLPPVPSLSRS